MKIPLNDLLRDYEDIQDKIEEAAIKVLRSGRFIHGPEVDAFEKELAKYLTQDDKKNIPKVVGCSSGTDALILALMALEIGPGDEVIVPSFSFGAPAEAVKRVGANIIFSDVDPETFNIDIASIKRVATQKTKAIIAVHLFGQCAPLKELKKICTESNWFLIEDAAQALGAFHYDDPAGTLGDIGCFSFYPTKNIGACGDAGALVCHDTALEKRLRTLRNHGYEKKYHHRYIGGNFRLDEIQAAILRVKLTGLDYLNTRRQEIANQYSNGLKLKLETPKIARGNSHIYHRYIVKSGERENLIKRLNRKKISNGIYYPLALHEQACFTHTEDTESFHSARLLSQQTLALPLFPSMRKEEVEHVINVICD